MKYKIPFLLFLLGILFIFAGFSTIKHLNNQVPEKSVSSSSTFPSATPTLTEQIKINSQKDGVFIARVLDGDTIETDSGERIRYLGINSPEKEQPFFDKAFEENKSLVLNKKVRLEFDVQARDRYNRLLAYVFESNTFVNLEMVRKGFAVSETIQPNVKYQKEILDAQKDARRNCLGLWEGLCNTSCIKITRINANAKGNDNTNKNGEWVEIENTCTSSISMTNWLLKDTSASNKYQFHNFLLDRNQKVILYSGCGQDSQTKLYWQCPEKKYAVWNNSGDHAFLYNEKGELASDYEY